MSLHVCILAAGKGSRMKSAKPKVLHALAGRPMFHHVVQAARQLSADRTHVVIGHGADSVRQSLPEDEVNWVTQDQQLGTGHAVAQALPDIVSDAVVLILYGDVPLIRPETLSELVAKVGENSMSLLTTTLSDPSGYGRIVRDEGGKVTRIVEQKDATEAEKKIKEVNTGILAAMASDLNKWLPELSSANAQAEYYLTDIIEMAIADEKTVEVCHPTSVEEVQGVNNLLQLSELERCFQKNAAESLMLSGVTIADPQRFDLRGEINIGQDVCIDINVILEGTNHIGNNVSIGPNCLLKNSRIDDNVRIEANSVLEDCVIGSDSFVGPFARLRPGTLLEKAAKVGNFVETKKAHVGEGSKINHLSYIGDSNIGKGVNIGAGTITCNYDGVNKYTTELGDDVFIGSNSSLVAPVCIKAGSTVGAGSVITKDVEADQLAVARGKQRNIDGWQKPIKK